MEHKGILKTEKISFSKNKLMLIRLFRKLSKLMIKGCPVGAHNFHIVSTEWPAFFAFRHPWSI